MFRNYLGSTLIFALVASSVSLAEIEDQTIAPNAALMTMYELQIRSANACHVDGGFGEADSCRKKQFAPEVTEKADVHPRIPYNPICDKAQKKRRPGTVGDLLLDTKDIRDRITLRYIRESVGINTLWLMPVHPNYEQGIFLPDPCDLGGSPYSSTDFMHVRASLSDTCIEQKRDETTSRPCWGNNHVLEGSETLAWPAANYFRDTPERKVGDPDMRQSDFQAAINKAKDLGMNIVMDIALNHTGVDYQFHDYRDAPTYRQYVENAQAAGVPVDDYMWGLLIDPNKVEMGLVFPSILDRRGEMSSEQVAEVRKIKGCRDADDRRLVVMQNLVNAAYSFERSRLQCDNIQLHFNLPGFYASDRNHGEPAPNEGDVFHEWRDVLKLYYAEGNRARMYEWVRAREFAFRVLNFWVSQGARGFRLDHASGVHPHVWNYIIRKVRKYQKIRCERLGIPYEDIVFFAEDYDNTKSNLPNFDAAWVYEIKDLQYMPVKNTSILTGLFDGLADKYGHKQRRDPYFGNGWGVPLFVLGLNTHDEQSIYGPLSGMDAWTGAAFHAIFTTLYAMTTMTVGQDFGETWQMPFRRIDHLPARWGPGHKDLDDNGKANLAAWYKKLHEARTGRSGDKLRYPSLAYGERYWLKTPYDTHDNRYMMYAKYLKDCSETTFVMISLWGERQDQTYAVTDDFAGKICLDANRNYKLINVFDGRNDWERTNGGTGGIRAGWEIKKNGLQLHFDPIERVKILKLELAR